MQPWFRAIALYFEPRVLGVLLLGFSSGLPFLLTLGTLQAWLSESGVTKTIIGLFALTTIPYAFKFLWAPLIDHVHIPLLTNRLGKRGAWMLVSQVALIMALMLLGSTDPTANIFLTAVCTFLVSVCAASQDNVIEAYRIEALSSAERGPGAGVSVIGFRIGMWVSGGGALYLSAIYDWFIVYTIMACCIMVGIIATLLAHEPKHLVAPKRIVEALPMSFVRRTRARLNYAVWPSLTSFFRRGDWYIVLPFIVFYKVGDSVLNMMSIPFLLEIGFTNVEIAHIAKSFGIVAMIVGGFLGGTMLMYRGIIQNLVFSVVLLILSCMMFMTQAVYGHNVTMLVLTMGIENLGCGISASVLIAYMSQLCSQPHTATHFAILSSFSSLARVSLSTTAGWVADQTDWVSFYGIVAAACLPALLMLTMFSGHFIKAIRLRSESI